MGKIDILHFTSNREDFSEEVREFSNTSLATVSDNSLLYFSPTLPTISDFATIFRDSLVVPQNSFKYLWRWPYKNGLEDLKKARWYLDRLISEVEKE